MNIDNVYEIMDRFEKSQISSMELEIEGVKIKLDKNGAHAVRTDYNDGLGSADIISNLADSTPDGSDFAKANSSDNEMPAKELTQVRAKVAGTFYRAPSPDGGPFAQEGQQVKAGDVLGMIEAMKMMNDITSPVDGTIVEILAENEALVGYDEVLITIDGGN